MMKSAVAATLISAAAAGNINLALQDCGDAATHGHVTSIAPTSVPQGAKTRVVGSGSVDEAVSAGTFNAEIKALGVTLKTCSGDFCAPTTCDLPQGTGSIALGGLSCPQAAGDVSLNFDVTVSASIPTALAVLEIDLTAASSDGDKLLCAKINTSPGESEDLESKRDPVEAEGKVGCDIIGAACKLLFKNRARSVVDCTEDAAEVAGICEAVGLGPEDPLADACAVSLAAVCEGACIEAINEGAYFGSKECKDAADCKKSLGFLAEV